VKHATQGEQSQDRQDRENDDEGVGVFHPSQRAWQRVRCGRASGSGDRGTMYLTISQCPDFAKDAGLGNFVSGLRLHSPRNETAGAGSEVVRTRMT
jgi:hypothetical protein